MSARNLKGLCHDRLFQFVNVNYASLCAMKLNLSEESTWKWQNHSVCPNSQVLQFFLFFLSKQQNEFDKNSNPCLYLKSSPSLSMIGIGLRELEIASCSSYKYSSAADNNVRTLKVRLFTTMVIKSQVKLYVNSNATKIPRESTTYITLFTARSRIFLPAAILLVALSWPPHKPTIYARLARWQLYFVLISL